MVTYIRKAHPVVTGIIVVLTLTLLCLALIAINHQFNLPYDEFRYQSSLYDFDLYYSQLSLFQLFVVITLIYCATIAHLFTYSRYKNMKKVIGKKQIIKLQAIILFIALVVIVFTEKQINAGVALDLGTSPYRISIGSWLWLLALLSGHHILDLSAYKEHFSFRKFRLPIAFSCFCILCFFGLSVYYQATQIHTAYYLDNIPQMFSDLGPFQAVTFIAVDGILVTVAVCSLALAMFSLVEYQKVGR